MRERKLRVRQAVFFIRFLLSLSIAGGYFVCMRICIDVQSAVTQRAGVGRYTRELVQHLPEASPDDEFVLAYFDFKAKGAPIAPEGVEERRIRWCPGRIAQLAWKTIHWPPFDAFAGDADLYHFPNFVLPPLRHGKSVVTIHDMTFLRYPHFTENRNARHLTACMQDTVERADAIITVSQFSADEVCALLDVRPERVFAVHSGISSGFVRPPSETIRKQLSEAGLDKPYILTVGTVEPRKNIPFLIDVFEQLSDFDGELVIAGGLGWKYGPILERITNSPRSRDIRYLQYAGDSLLPSLYAGAELFVLTSFYEGFGFPPLEAMACGTPVVSSAGGSLREILGDAAIVLDDFDCDLWIEKIRQALSDSVLRKELASRGHAQAKKYSWAAAAAETHNVYQQVLQ